MEKISANILTRLIVLPSAQLDQIVIRMTTGITVITTIAGRAPMVIQHRILTATAA